jgi:serine/threonine protein kinase
MSNMRKYKYYILSTGISYLSDKQIENLDVISEKKSTGHGKNSIITINNHKVFTKRIPITQLEYDNKFDTYNFYNLPTYYNYGVGSAGINCFRELAMHIKTTNWVLGDQIEHFPLLYHYRIVKNNKPLIHFNDKKKLKEHTKYWNNNKNIKKYIIAKNNAKYEIVLFLEYIQYDWHMLAKSDIGQINTYIFQILNTINFLKKNNIIHFDAHGGNILSDGTNFYLTDFGLMLDMEYNLTDNEIKFFKNNTHYHYPMIMDNISEYLFKEINKNRNKKYGYTDDMNKKNIMI